MALVTVLEMMWLWGVVCVACQIARQPDRGSPWRVFGCVLAWPLILLAWMIGKLAEFTIDNLDEDR